MYLTFDTGHMGVAPLVAEVLKRQGVKATFFAAQERTKEGDGTLGRQIEPDRRGQAPGGAPGQGRQVATRGVDARSCGKDLTPLSG